MTNSSITVYEKKKKSAKAERQESGLGNYLIP